MERMTPVTWPDGKSFAFTIFDDTDNATVDRVAPVYELLGGLGFRTTKSVWAISGSGTARLGGETCDDPGYRAWTLELQAAGFEIASHGASYETSARDRVVMALDRFREVYGHDPDSLANHAECAESIYWGADRLSGSTRLAYNAVKHAGAACSEAVEGIRCLGRRAGSACSTSATSPIEPPIRSRCACRCPTATPSFVNAWLLRPIRRHRVQSRLSEENQDARGEGERASCTPTSRPGSAGRSTDARSDP
jgi:hypothetical protein